jgi:hypothetical protein
MATTPTKTLFITIVCSIAKALCVLRLQKAVAYATTAAVLSHCHVPVSNTSLSRANTAEGAMDVDVPSQPAGAAAGERPAPSAATAAQPPRVPEATAASAVLPAVAHEDLEEEAAAERLIQPRENPLQIAARCMSKLPAVVRLALARASVSDVTNSQKCSILTYTHSYTWALTFENFYQGDSFLAAQAVSRIVASYPHILPLLLRHFRTSKSLLSLLEGAPSLPPQARILKSPIYSELIVNTLGH